MRNAITIASIRRGHNDHWEFVIKTLETFNHPCEERVSYRGSPIIARKRYNDFCVVMLNCGWKDIEHVDYKGQLTRANFSYLVEPEGVDSREHVVKVKAKKDEEDLSEVECVDNWGLEDFFRVGVTYCLQGEKKNTYLVYDKLGELREVLKERFKLV
jgi:hypothetical protein